MLTDIDGVADGVVHGWFTVTVTKRCWTCNTTSSFLHIAVYDVVATGDTTMLAPVCPLTPKSLHRHIHKHLSTTVSPLVIVDLLAATLGALIGVTVIV